MPRAAIPSPSPPKSPKSPRIRQPTDPNPGYHLPPPKPVSDVSTDPKLNFDPAPSSPYPKNFDTTTFKPPFRTSTSPSSTSPLPAYTNVVITAVVPLGSSSLLASGPLKRRKSARRAFEDEKAVGVASRWEMPVPNMVGR